MRAMFRNFAPQQRTMLRLQAALVTPARSLVGALRQCVRFESSGNSRNWNLRAPDGWIYARHLKHKYGKRYITKQEWARQNGMWKGAPVARTRSSALASDAPPRPSPRLRLQVPRPGNSSPGHRQARPSPAYKETQCRSWRRPTSSSCSSIVAQ